MSADQTRVVVTGFGAVTPLGDDAASTWTAMLAGKSGVRRLTDDWEIVISDLPPARALSDGHCRIDQRAAQIVCRVIAFAGIVHDELNLFVNERGGQLAGEAAVLVGRLPVQPRSTVPATRQRSLRRSQNGSQGSLERSQIAHNRPLATTFRSRTAHSSGGRFPHSRETR